MLFCTSNELAQSSTTFIHWSGSSTQGLPYFNKLNTQLTSWIWVT
jgi:hypothetical protein